MPPHRKRAALDGYPCLLGAMWSGAATTEGHAMRIACGAVFDRHPGATLILGHMGELLPFQTSRSESHQSTSAPTS